MRFITNARGLGVHAAILKEVQARQERRVEEVLANWRDKGIGNALTLAELGVRRNGSNGRDYINNDVGKALEEEGNRLRATQGERAAGSWVLGKIQSHYQLGAESGGLNSRQIAESFTKNGGGVDAADIALAYLEVGHDHIQANEMNDLARHSGDRSAAAAPKVVTTKARESRAEYNSRDGERDRNARDAR